MFARIAFLAIALAALSVPAWAQDTPQSGLAPADEYFGRFRISVLGISNMIKDGGDRLADGSDPAAVLDGPLAFVTDAIHDWEHRFPNDPWIAKDLYKLEGAYLKAGSDRGNDLARRTVAWLVHDYPNAAYVADARSQLAAAGLAPGGGEEMAAEHDVPTSAWERFASSRVPVAGH